MVTFALTPLKAYIIEINSKNPHPFVAFVSFFAYPHLSDVGCAVVRKMNASYGVEVFVVSLGSELIPETVTQTFSRLALANNFTFP